MRILFKAKFYLKVLSLLISVLVLNGCGTSQSTVKFGNEHSVTVGHIGYGLVPQLTVEARQVAEEHCKKFDKSAVYSGIVRDSGVGPEEFDFHCVPSKSKKDNVVKENNINFDDDKIYDLGIGTGFFVNNKGNFLTNSHVVDNNCQSYKARVNENLEFFKISIISNDKKNDLIIGKIDSTKKTNYIKFAKTISLGEDIFVAGFPLSNVLKSKTIKINKGIVSSMSGADNDFSEIQIDATVQPGNSGGPIVNNKGDLVGIATYIILNAQNTNFGKRNDLVQIFLKSNNIMFEESNQSSSLSNQEIASNLSKSTIQIYCSNTGRDWMRLIENKKISSNVSEIIK